MTTKTGVSGVGAGTVLTSMVVYTLLYAALAVVEIKLFLDYTRRGADPAPPDEGSDSSDSDHETPAPVSFVY